MYAVLGRAGGTPVYCPGGIRREEGASAIQALGRNRRTRRPGIPVPEGAGWREFLKRLVWEAYRKVAANKGAAGVDGQSIAKFEEDLKGNLYKLWNRLSSGTYFPPP